jgi:hypothetical protein
MLKQVADYTKIIKKLSFPSKKRKFVRTRYKSTGNFPSQERALTKSLDETNKTLVLD